MEPEIFVQRSQSEASFQTTSRNRIRRRICRGQLQQQLHQQEEDRGMVWSREVEPEQDRVEQEQSERQENESAVRQQLPPSQKNGHVASEVVENGRRGQGPSQVA
uniref:(northern house mosquito) hypothetical protein n=1 Tax=Culex pipiens TaxID=7175 RepID=A0A8D8DBE6_CULPI